jgi:hypothetical protein
MVTNCVIKRFRMNFTAFGGLPGGTTTWINRTVSARHGLSADCIGIGIPINGDMNAGLTGLIIRATSPTTIRIGITNSSAAFKMQPPLSYNIYMFMPTGMTDQTV